MLKKIINWWRAQTTAPTRPEVFHHDQASWYDGDINAR